MVRAIRRFSADQVRALAIGLDLAPQPADLHVDAAVEGVVALAVGQVDQLVAGENALGVFKKHYQQVELATGQRDHDALGRTQFATGDIQMPTGEGNHRA